MRLKNGFPDAVRRARRVAARRGRRLRIMFADEARFGRMNRPRPCWAPAGIRPEVAAQLVRESYSPELNPQENIWDEVREKIFKNYALKSMDEVNDKLDEAALYIERNPRLVKSITSFPYIAKSF